ncbi:flagellar hook-basal body complex protein FliE [Desulfofustis glycolicus]|uniref:Flagellar hook-basal body complex protein FliE n=1 Tax=Desulfofustis glycolicus DSM 9705 TaxID=1121409 RepID=A0A1M5U328_9BACT|nr:flagellar hook-basal body complex protein FliE [Desulfofustis glycolicus]MCB2214698.1 flagellar hook-basal body complex protein FliE [Desulfobulbaceae bacterium]SHH57073.1 flagellar hook-basal body complex protein FliE [Desulfofustis glycolicus DSM 9705]
MTITPLPPAGANTALPINRIDGEAITASRNDFTSFLENSIDQVNQAMSRGDRSIEMLHSGQAQSLHEVMIAVEEADISLRMFVQIRNKALQAYEEIMRMQI